LANLSLGAFKEFVILVVMFQKFQWGQKQCLLQIDRLECKYTCICMFWLNISNRLKLIPSLLKTQGK
jgi:hypothetical protein